MERELLDRIREACGTRISLSQMTINLYERYLRQKKEEASQQRLLVEQVHRIVPRITNNKNKTDIKTLDEMNAWEVYFEGL